MNVRRWLRLAVVALAASWAGAANLALAGAATVALPQLPAKISDQLQIEALQREIEIIRLEQELRDMRDAANSDLATKIKQLEDMRTLLEVNAEVRQLVQVAPELDAQYWRILDVDTPSPACRCLEALQVNWLGRGAQTGRATIRIDGQHYDVEVGGTVGSSSCTLQTANAERATFTCGNTRKTLGLYSPVGN